MPCNEFRNSGRRRRGLSPLVECRCRGPAGGAGRRPGRQRGFRLQAAADGAAIVAVIAGAPAALELVIVQQALVGRLELLHAFLQSPPLLVHCLPQASLLPLQSLLVLRLALLLRVAVAQVHLC
eukprot:scaffold3304_cov72-Phaeocystis_antarctica.AAC.1